MSALAQGDRVVAKQSDDLYVEIFAGRIGTIVGTHREWGGIVARVRFPDDEEHTFYADGLRRVRGKEVGHAS